MKRESSRFSGVECQRLYPRGGENPTQIVAKIRGGADDTDGLEATTTPLGPDFPRGILVVMNSVGRNFWIYDWRDIERGLAPAAN